MEDLTSLTPGSVVWLSNGCGWATPAEVVLVHPGGSFVLLRYPSGRQGTWHKRVVYQSAADARNFRVRES